MPLPPMDLRPLAEVDKGRVSVYFLHMDVIQPHYHVWILDIKARGGQLYFEEVPHPGTYVHRTSAYRVRSRLISGGTRAELVSVHACHSSPCPTYQPELFDSQYAPSWERAPGRGFNLDEVVHKKRGGQKGPPRD